MWQLEAACALMSYDHSAQLESLGSRSGLISPCL
ncbi:unnamed protein product [Rhodiola kirilowii]